jgi:serine/threonine protein kinase
VPFSPSAENGRFPGTPRSVAAPELLLKLPSEITPAIDVWALGCVIYLMVSEDAPFDGVNDPLGDCLADIMLSLGGEMNIPARFMDAFRESGAMLSAQKPGRHDLDWDEKFTMAREDRAKGFGKEDEAVLRKVMSAAFVIDPGARASMAEILGLLLQGWQNM